MRHLKRFENFSDKSSLLETILPEVKDILTGLEDFDIDFEIMIGQYHKMTDSKSSTFGVKTSEVDSINIDIKDNVYNFFIFNEHVLPTLKTLQSFVSDYDLNIDIELIQENEFYTLDEFVKEFSGEEFHELGIIIY
jgi:hypothetical protein